MIVLVNQFCGPLCRDMAYSMAKDFGSVELITGNITVPVDQVSHAITIHKGREYNRKNFGLRFLSWILFSLSSFFRLLLRRRKDVAWVLVSNPPMLPLLLGALARLKKIPYFIVVYDLYPDVLDQTGLAGKNSFLYKLWSRSNQQVFKKAGAVFTLSTKMKEALSAYMPPEKINSTYVIPNWADTPGKKPSDAEILAFRKEHGFEQQFIVLYAGNMGMTHDLESLVECAHLLKDEKDLLVVFAGEGYKKIKLQELVTKLQLQNVRFIPFQSNENFPVMQAAADIGVITMGKGAEGFSVPSKTYSALAAGQCILSISSENSELDRLIAQFNTGKNITPGDANGAASFIRAVKNSPILAATYKQNSLNASAEFTVLNASLYCKYIGIHI